MGDLDTLDRLGRGGGTIAYLIWAQSGWPAVGVLVLLGFGMGWLVGKARRKKRPAS